MRQKLALALMGVTACTFPAAAQTGSSKSTSALQSEINSLFPDQTTGAITPFDLRQVTLDITASFPNFNNTSYVVPSGTFGANNIIVGAGGVSIQDSLIAIGNMVTASGAVTAGHMPQFTGTGKAVTDGGNIFPSGNTVGYTPPQVFNIADFGAVGNGVTDDAVAFQNALNACNTAGGGEVVLGPHRYLVDSTNITVPSQCQVYCSAPLLGARGTTTPIDFTTTPFTVLLNASFQINLNNYTAWRGCAVLQKNASVNTSTTRGLLNLAAAFGGLAFNVGADVEIDDTFIGGFNTGVTTTNLGAPRLRISRMNIDANNCGFFDNIHDIPYMWSLHCFPFLMNDRGNADPGYAISGIADNGGGLWRVTTSSATAIQTGDTVWVNGNIVGASSAYNKWTATAINNTTIDLQGSTSGNPTPTASNTSGSQLLTGFSSLLGIAKGTTVSGPGIPASTTVLAVQQTCNCVLINKQSTSTNANTAFTFTNTAYVSGGSIFLQADYRPADGIIFSNTDRAVCNGCFVYNHSTGIHLTTGANWIGCNLCAVDGNLGNTNDPTAINVLIDSTAKGAVFSGMAMLAATNPFVINSNTSLSPHLITGSTIEAAQGNMFLELDNGAVNITGSGSGTSIKWITIMDAAQSLMLQGNFFRNAFTAQSPASQAKVVSSGVNASGHTGATGASVAANTCGSNPSVSAASTDYDGTVTEGTTAVGCTISFANGFTKAPSCTVTSRSGLGAFTYSVGANSIALTHNTASGSIIDWHCGDRDAQ